MPLLTDAQLRDRLNANPDIVRGLDTTRWAEYDSAIQPASIDLHVGDVYLPGESSPGVPGTLKPRAELTLSTGQTAVVVTKEHLNMPQDWAAYGFPPSHISAQGLLMTNPGHIDPGFSGKLRFTVINMSAVSFSLRRGDAIVTLIVHLLAEPVAHDFTQRRTAAGLGVLPDPSWDDVNRLAKDFVDVEARSKRIASAEVQTAQDRLNRLDTRTKWFTVLAAALGVLGTILVGWLTGLQGVRNDVNDLKSKIDVVELKNEIKGLAERVTAVERKVPENKK